MPKLDHVNIQTHRLEETVAFWRDLIGLMPRAVPGMDPSLIQWMHDEEERAIIHLVKSGTIFEEAPAAVSGTTGAIHHVALDCTDHDAMVARLEQHGLAYRCNDIPAIELRQIFVHDPNGVLVELNFRAGSK